MPPFFSPPKSSSISFLISISMQYIFKLKKKSIELLNLKFVNSCKTLVDQFELTCFWKKRK